MCESPVLFVWRQILEIWLGLRSTRGEGRRAAKGLLAPCFRQPAPLPFQLGGGRATGLSLAEEPLQLGNELPNA